MAEQTTIFAQKAQDYAGAWSERSTRGLRHDEVAQVAAAFGAAFGSTDVPKLLFDVQAAQLQTQQDPPRHEVLLAAGLATAPAFIAACLDFVALIEMASEDFEDAYENGDIWQAIKEAGLELKRLPVAEGRKRTEQAFAHIAEQAGTSPGEVVGLILRALGTALGDGIGPLSPFGSLIGSVAPTDGPAESASTEPDGETPET